LEDKVVRYNPSALEREKISPQLPQGAKILSVRVGYVREIEEGQAVIHLKGLRPRVFDEDYIRGRGLDDGSNKFLALVTYRVNRKTKSDLVRLSQR
jgi:hypothetical protein